MKSRGNKAFAYGKAGWTKQVIDLFGCLVGCTAPPYDNLTWKLVTAEQKIGQTRSGPAPMPRALERLASYKWVGLAAAQQAAVAALKAVSTARSNAYSPIGLNLLPPMPYPRTLNSRHRPTINRGRQRTRSLARRRNMTANLSGDPGTVRGGYSIFSSRIDSITSRREWCWKHARDTLRRSS